KHRRGFSRQLLRCGIPEDRGDTMIAALDHPITSEHDTDRLIFNDRGELEERAPKHALRLLVHSAILDDPDSAVAGFLLVLCVADEIDPDIAAVLAPHGKFHLKRL